MKVIFLDVDGVLNNNKALLAAEADPPICPPGPLGSVFTVDPDCVKLLREVVEELGLKIVLSSTWRFHPHAFKTAMKWCGWEDVPLIGMTPRRALKELNGFERGSEIDEWLEGNPDVEKFCILDDESKVFQKDRLVLTSSSIGLTKTICEQIKKIME